MDGRSVHEGVCDMVWYTNIKLLGFAESKIPILPTMFDHSNPSAFQHVFHFLFMRLNKDRSNVEFRDCWPILDKKQEAEFRRKVIAILKDYQKEFPDDLPYTNPSLFQSPGGRKFLKFLSVFTTFVLKQQVSKETEVLFKPSPSTKPFRRISLKFLTDQTKDNLEAATKSHIEVSDNDVKNKECIGNIHVKFLDYKKKFQDLEDIADPDEKVIGDEFEGKLNFVKETFEEAKAMFDKSKESFNVVQYVTDESVEKLKLNLSDIASSLENTSMIAIYQSLLDKVLATAEKVATKQAPIFFSEDLNIEEETEMVEKIQATLEQFFKETKNQVDGMMEKSMAIDWNSCGLVRNLNKEASVKLLPPTPSIVNVIQNAETRNLESCRHLNLSSPDPRLRTPGVRSGHLSSIQQHVTPVRSVPSAALSRRFAITKPSEPEPFNSPVLKPIERKEESYNLTIQSETDLNNSRKVSVSSSFSPMLSSTTQAERTFSEIAEASKHDQTQHKIDMYRKVLNGIKAKSEAEDKSVLLSAWTAHRESLSPRVTKRRSRSPGVYLMDPNQSPATLVKTYSPLRSVSVQEEDSSPKNDLVITRLDQLMTSLTLNENPSGLNISLDEELDLLSPNL